MPPEENTNKNAPNFDTFKVGSIDPVFKSNLNQQKTQANQSVPAGAYGVLSNQKYTPSQPPVSTILPKTETNSAVNPKSIIRTYKGDLESAIQSDHLSSINIAIAENQKMHSQITTEQTPPESSANYSKSKVLIFVSAILIITGIIGVAITYFVKNQNSNAVVQTQELPSLITTEFKDELNVSMIGKDRLISTLSSKLNDTQITVNNFDNIYMTTGSSTARRLINSGEFVSLMNFKIPDIAKRTLLPDFMVGMYSFGKNLPFVILKTSSFENTYAGMLTWEKDLEKDFQVIFRLPGYENSGGILAELTPGVSKKFEDAVIANKDTRLIRGVDGQIILLYGIIDKETIIITVNDVTFKEILNRLNKEKGLKR